MKQSIILSLYLFLTGCILEPRIDITLSNSLKNAGSFNLPLLVFTNKPNSGVVTSILNVSVGGPNIISYRYKFGQNSITNCTDAAGYSGLIDIGTAITDDLSSFSAQNMTLCGVGISNKSIQQTYENATQFSWSNGSPIIALITGGPVGTSSSNFSTMTIGGASVTKFVFKVGDASLINCSLETGYSSQLNIGTYNFDFSDLEDGQLKFCVLGISSTGSSQFLTTSTEISWLKETPAVIEFLSGANEINEGSGSISVPVKLSHKRSTDVRVSLSSSGTAIEGTHFTFDTKTLIIPAGSVTASFNINILNDIPAGEDRALQIYFDNLNYNEVRAEGIWYTNYLIQDSSATRDLVSSVSMKFRHSCIVKDSGRIGCLGVNSNGNLGNGTTNYNDAFSYITGTNWKSVAVGDSFTCATDLSDIAYCWGGNSSGSIGIGLTNSISYTTPQLVTGGLIIKQISVGQRTACGLTDNKKIFCWGSNNSGLLGNNSIVNSTSPTPISRNDLNWRSVSLSYNHVCAIEDGSGALWCWGDNEENQLDGTMIDSWVPKLIDSTDSYKFVSVGQFSTCAINTNDDLKCWGGNYGGEAAILPWGSGADFPTHVDIGIKYKSVVVGGEFMGWSPRSCGITLADEIRCWGNDYLEFGYVGRKPSGDDEFPAYVDPGATYRSLSLNEYAACGVTSNGNLRCFGSISSYGVPRIYKNVVESPIDVMPTRVFKNLFFGDDSMCAIDSSDHLFCLGNRAGSADLFQRMHWVKIQAINTFKKAALGEDIKCAIDVSNQLWCWGRINSPTYEPEPQIIPGIVALDVSAGKNHVCVLNDQFKILCMGGDWGGALGLGTVGGPWSYTFNEIVGSLTFKSLSASGSGNCAIGTNDRVYCWGQNFYGDGTAIRSSGTPSLTNDTTSYASISSSGNNCGITITGSLKCWGQNSSGEIGNGGSVGGPAILVPTNATTAELFSKVVTAPKRSCAINNSSKLFCFGRNNLGFFGTPSNVLGTGNQNIIINTPTAVDPLNNYIDVAFIIDTNNICALTSAGRMKCWGGTMGFLDYDAAPVGFGFSYDLPYSLPGITIPYVPPSN